MTDEAKTAGTESVPRRRRHAADAAERPPTTTNGASGRRNRRRAQDRLRPGNTRGSLRAWPDLQNRHRGLPRGRHRHDADVAELSVGGRVAGPGGERGRERARRARSQGHHRLGAAVGPSRMSDEARTVLDMWCRSASGGALHRVCAIVRSSKLRLVGADRAGDSVVARAISHTQRGRQTETQQIF